VVRARDFARDFRRAQNFRARAALRRRVDLFLFRQIGRGGRDTVSRFLLFLATVHPIFYGVFAHDFRIQNIARQFSPDDFFARRRNFDFHSRQKILAIFRARRSCRVSFFISQFRDDRLFLRGAPAHDARARRTFVFRESSIFLVGDFFRTRRTHQNLRNFARPFSPDFNFSRAAKFEKICRRNFRVVRDSEYHFSRDCRARISRFYFFQSPRKSCRNFEI